MTCPELLSNRSEIELEELAQATDTSLYRYLHNDGKRLISSWFKRAWDKRNCEKKDCYEPFIFTWIAFNGWSACVTSYDTDRDWMHSLMLSVDVCQKFNTLIADNNSIFSQYANEFKYYWPIFKSQEIRRRGIQRISNKNREYIVNHYLSNNVNKFEPQCWTKHRERQEEAPLDWPHTLAALYRVRCNLFHGEKSPDSENDRLIVSSAFRVLVHFLKDAHYIL
ncbi:MAG: hypothetical protein AB1491_13925 [Thermodesulfobacteriota bacterium]